MKRILLLFFAICFVFVSNSQLVTNTNINRTKGTLNKENLDNAVIRCLYERKQLFINSGNREYAIDTLTLKLGKRYSLFYDENKIYRDSLFTAFGRSFMPELKVINANTKADIFQDLRAQGGRYIEKNAAGESVRLYKDRKNKTIISIDYEGVLYAFKLTENLPPQQWKIANDTLTVMGYLCQKAVSTFRGRNYIAWFTSEIPVNDGPWKLYGLPGLILKAYTEDEIFMFEAIGIEKLINPVKITMDKDEYIRCNRKEMEKVHLKNKTSSRLSYFKDGIAYVGSRIEPWVFEPMELE